MRNVTGLSGIKVKLAQPDHWCFIFEGRTLMICRGTTCGKREKLVWFGRLVPKAELFGRAADWGGIPEQLFEAHEIELQSVRGESETKDFILEYVFQLSPRTSIRTDADLWHQLLRLHFGNREIPAVLAQRVAQVVHGKGLLPNQPVDSWITSKSIFLHVVQVAWYRYFENRGITGIRTGEPLDAGEWSSLEIPFEHSDVRSIVHQMFVEGALHPLQVQPSSAQGIPEWAKAGIVPDPGAMRDLVFDGIHNIKQTMPTRIPPLGSGYTYLAGWVK